MDEEFHESAEADPQQGAEQREESRLAWEAMSALAARQQTALFLREVEGHSYRQIAGVLRTSESAVEDLLFRARRGIAKAYNHMAVTPGARCRQARGAMAALMDGEAGPVQQRALRAHADACQGCRAELQSLRQGSAGYLALPLLAGADAHQEAGFRRNRSEQRCGRWDEPGVDRYSCRNKGAGTGCCGDGARSGRGALRRRQTHRHLTAH